MATILLTDDEYQHVQSLLSDLTAKIPTASPRAATLYGNLARLSSEFLAKEDGKRSLAKTKATARESLAQAKQARRSAAQSTAQQPAPGSAGGGRARANA